MDKLEQILSETLRKEEERFRNMKSSKQITNCIGCPLVTLHICGKETKAQTTSSGARKDIVPDHRCKLREGKL